MANLDKRVEAAAETISDLFACILNIPGIWEETSEDWKEQIRSDARGILSAADAAGKQYFWNAEDWEVTYDNVAYLTEDWFRGEVMRVGRAVALPDVWVVRGHNGEVKEFATKAEAGAFSRLVTQCDD